MSNVEASVVSLNDRVEPLENRAGMSTRAPEVWVG